MVEPISYNLKLSIDKNWEKVQGNLILKVRGPESKRLSELLLDCWPAIVVKSARLESREIEAEILEKEEKLKLKFGHWHVMGEFTVEIDYEFWFAEKFEGIYLVPGLGDKKFMASQMEPTYAKKVLPCFDDPLKKARFTMEISWFDPDGKMEAFSNMPREIVAREGDVTRVTFMETPMMSPYLLVFIIMEVKSRKEHAIKREKNGKFKPLALRVQPEEIKLEVLSYRKNEKELEFALEVAIKALTFLEEYLNTEYPLPKITFVPIPNFPLGGMENWGCITFCESCILLDRERSSILQKRNVAETVIHEVAHLWFGDLVTMKSWSDLWLNEAFATWTSYKISIEMGYCTWEDFISGETFRALSYDRLGPKISHPIHIENMPKNPTAQEINEFFDEITYQKGAAIVKMIEMYLGEDKFRDGLRLYMSENALMNVDRETLWKALGLGSEIDSWVTNAGFPLIEFDAEGKPKLVRGLWANSFLVWLSKEENRPWAYAVYKEKLGTLMRTWSSHSKSLKLKIINDISILFKMREIKGVSLNIFIYKLIPIERHAQVLKELIDTWIMLYVTWSRAIVKNKEDKKKLQTAGSGDDISDDLVKVIMDSKEGLIEGTAEEIKLMHSSILDILRILGFDDFNKQICEWCIDKAIFVDSDDPNEFLRSLDQDNLGSILAILVQESGRDVFETILGWIKVSGKLEERFRYSILEALVWSNWEGAPGAILNYIERDCVSIDCYYALISLMSESRCSTWKVWDWFKVNYDLIRGRLGRGNILWNSVIEGILGRLYGQELVEDAAKFCKEMVKKGEFPAKAVTKGIEIASETNRLLDEEAKYLF